jgi:hypothetical protein
MGYIVTTYAIPGSSATLNTTNNNVVYGNWVNLASPIAAPAGTWFATPVWTINSYSHTCPNGWWDHFVGIDLGDSGSSSLKAITIGGLYNHNTSNCGGGNVWSYDINWTGTIAKYRLYTVGQQYYGPQPATVNINFGGGEIRVYVFTL